MWFDADFSFSEQIKRTCKACFLQMRDFRRIRKYLTSEVAVLAANDLVSSHLVTLCSEVCPVSISTNCKVFRTPLLVLLQIIESMLMLHPFYRNSTGCLLSILVFSKPQHLCINFCIVVLLTSNRSCLLVVVPIVLGIVTQIVNTLQFLLSIHQSLSQPNILAIVLPLMLLRSGMTSLKMFAVQHELPPSERS